MMGNLGQETASACRRPAACTNSLLQPQSKYEGQLMTPALSGVAPAKPLRQGAQRAHHGRLRTQPSRPFGRREASLDAVVGIDLGTSNSAIGIVDSNEARIVETGDGATTRSWVAFTEVRPVMRKLSCQRS